MSPLQIIDSTLREGEQFAGAHFTLEQKLRIVELLDAFGAEYAELTSPVASPESARDCRSICDLPRRVRILAHTRCHPEDIDRALECGVDGVNMPLRTSGVDDVSPLIERAVAMIERVRAAGREVRFSCEDAFRTDPQRLLRIHSAVAQHGPDRVGIADTVGVATIEQVTAVVSALRGAVDCGIEFHGHNDSGCAVATAWAAHCAGATHIDTTILGIGERNGITSLSGLVARALTAQPDAVGHYRLNLLPQMDSTVAAFIGQPIPFSEPLTAPAAFTHKAGLHTHAVLSNPSTYESVAPEVVGRSRRLLTGHRLTGRHAVAHRARHLGRELDEVQVGELTREVKRRADAGPIDDTQLDQLVLSWEGN